MPEHNGHEITVTDEYMFLVKGPAFEDDGGRFSSYRQAIEAVNEGVAALAKQRRAEGALSLPVLSGDGAKCSIRGIHMGRRTVLGLPAPRRNTRLLAYPDVPWVADALKERARLTAQLRAVDERLAHVSIPTSYGYGSVKSEEYDRLIDRLVREHTEKTALAETMANAAT